MKIVKIVKNNKIWILLLFLCIVLGIVYYNTNIIEKFTVDEYNYIHKVLLDNLEKTIEIFKNHNIEYWGIAGTLLGCVRESKIIDKDDDIDLGLFKDDFLKLQNNNNNIIKDFNDKGLHLIITPTELYHNKIVSKRNDNDYEKNNIFIDIMCYEEYDDKFNLNQEIYSDDFWKNEWFYKNELYPLVKSNLNHLKINIPNKPIKYLERAYDNWKIPDNKESPHESVINLSI